MAAGPQHIKNPFEMLAESIGSVFGDLEDALRPRPASAARTAPVVVRKIGARDLMDSLKEGLSDLGAARADVLFIGLIYVLSGLVIGRAAFQQDLLPLVFPLISGFALVGPVAALGLYEISRRREKGEDVGLMAGLGVLRSPSLPAILGLSVLFLALFLAWMVAAQAIYAATLGPEPPVSAGAFLNEVLTTPQGWAMTVIGLGVGFLFAALVFSIGVISFPLLLDRDVGIYAAMGASLRAVSANPGTMALWGAIIAGLLAVGSLPALLGLIIVLPLLGHASWRLYRKVVAPA